jgi:hypothetical protein
MRELRGPGVDRPGRRTDARREVVIAPAGQNAQNLEKESPDGFVTGRDADGDL